VSDRLGRVEKRYVLALEQYLSGREEIALLRAYELGRAALGDGLGVLEMATVHARAVAAVLNRQRTDEERVRLLEVQINFFVEALSPFEITHRAFREANTVLRLLNDMLEGQAKRIAYALHDEAAQLLASVHLEIADVASKLPAETAKQLASVKGLLNQIEERLRNYSHELRPPVLEDLGLFPALELLADGVSKRWGLPVTVTASLNEYVPATIESTVYRITQEALTNAAKHAKATRVEVDLRLTAQKIVCSVRDDGIGFDVNALSSRKRRTGLGLIEIKERVAALGGVLRVGRNKDRGTDLTVEIPLEG
jgi:signal transduction histidine kinase